MTVKRRKRSCAPIRGPGKRSGCANEASRIGRTGGAKLRESMKGEYRHEKSRGIHGCCIPVVLGGSCTHECRSNCGSGNGMDANSKPRPIDLGLHQTRASARKPTEA